MKLKDKMIVLLFIMFTILLVAPSMVNAAETYTYEDTAQGITWSYELDGNDNVVNLKCTTTSKTGAVIIPSEIAGKTVISLKSKVYDGAFQDCAGITSVTIPNTITQMGQYAFYRCTGLKTITIPDSVTKIENHAFAECTGLTSITLSKNLITIENSAFTGCSKVGSLTIPNSVTSIGANAFRNCSGLRELTLSENLTKITDRCFEGCNGLTSVIIPDSVTTIEGSNQNVYGAFGKCANLTKVLIPDSVASIGIGAFQGCTKLTIYGTEGEASHTYAQENNINFKLISEWDNAGVGDDISGPQVEKIEVTRACLDGLEEDDGMWMFPTGKKVVINVYFTEVVHGDTTPTLTIKCGQGENIELTNGTISSKHVIYEYIIKQGDIGIMSTVSLAGGNLADSTGNAAKLSCPRLEVDWVSISEEYVYANGTTANPEDDQTGEWTDFSKAKFELKKDDYSNAMLEISGVTPKENSSYYWCITSNNSKPNVTSEDESVRFLSYDEDEQLFYIAGMEAYVELNQDMYVTIFEKQNHDEKILIYGKKIERYEEPKYSDAFYSTFVSNNNVQILTTFTHKDENNRKIQIKIGKITDISILQKIKKEDVSGFASLLSFAKSNQGMYDELVDAEEKGFRIGCKTEINLKGLEDKEYYFLYVKTYDENGKYVSNEAVTLAQASVNSFTDTWLLNFFGEGDFEWADFGDVKDDAGKEDDTKAPIQLPNTGKVTIVSILLLTAVAGVRSFIKTRKYRGI